MATNMCSCEERTIPWSAWRRGVRKCRACKSRDRRYGKMPTRQLEDAKRIHERQLESINTILSDRPDA